MPSWTLGEISSRVTNSLGRRADIDASDVSFWVNQAYHIVVEAADHALQERIAVASTVSGDNRIQLPPDARQLLNLSYLTAAGNSRRTFRQISPHEFDARFEKQKSGQPVEYVLYSDFLELWPSPNSAYSIQMRYMSEATDLVATTDIPSISTPWRFAVYLKTKELILQEHLGRRDDAREVRDEYLAHVAQIPSDQERRQSTYDRPAVNLAYVHPKGR